MIPLSIRPSSISSLGTGISIGGRTLSELLQAFAVLAPPERVMHVGIGSQQSETLCWRDWSLNEAIVIDAEEQVFENVETELNPNIKLYKHSAVLADSVGPADYYVANNLAENGLVDPTLLRMVWPSLAQSHRYKKDAITLDHLVVDKALQSWLIIDCLPAVRILSGATDTLKDTLLVCVRALAEAGFRGEPEGADVTSIDACLGEQGFKRLTFVTGLNPKIGHAIYGRPAEKPIAAQDLPFVKELNLDLESLRKKLLETAEEKQRVFAELSKERDILQARATELQAQLKTTAEKHAAASNQQSQAHTQEQAALSAKLTQMQKQVDAQTQGKDKALEQFAASQKSVQTTQKSLVDIQSALAEVQKSEVEAKKAAVTSAIALKQAQANQQAVQVNLIAKTKEHDTLHARVTELEAQLKTTAEKHVAETTQQAQAHAQEQDVLSAKLTEMQKQVEAQAQAKNKALEQFAAAQKSAETTQMSLQTTQKSLADVQSNLAKVQQSEAEAKKTVETSAAGLKQVQAKHQALQVKLDASTKERDTLQARITELEAQLKTTAEKHAAVLTQQTQAHTRAHAAKSAKLAEIQKQFEAQKEAKDTARQQLTDALKAVQTTQKSLADVQSALAEVQQSEAKVKKTVETSDAAHKQAQAALSAKLTETQKQVDAQRQAKDKALEQFAAAQKAAEITLKSLTDAEKVAVGAKKSLETTSEVLKDKETVLQAELSRVQSLTAENQELAQRQQLMNEELIKAEGQISLIKDLLLREQGI